MSNKALLCPYCGENINDSIAIIRQKVAEYPKDVLAKTDNRSVTTLVYACPSCNKILGVESEHKNIIGIGSGFPRKHI